MESQGGMNYYRLNNHHVFLASLGISGVTAYPMMSRDWQVTVSDSSLLENVSLLLSQITVGGESLFEISQNNQESLFISTAITRKVELNEVVELGGKKLDLFYNLFTNIAIKSGHHISKGSLWVSQEIENSLLYDGMPITSLFELNLNALGVTSPVSMQPIMSQEKNI